MSSEKRTILIADDEDALRALVRVTLDTGRFEILEAANGVEALALAREHKPDLVFLDWAMPGLSGLEVCKRLRADDLTRDLMIVMLTARAQEFDRAAALDVGVDAYITKPFSPLRLLDAVRDKLGAASLVS
ncbi:MAG: response regulator [Solirubrobacteraceae bacterium]|nr:response regulator [Solirubrobacteraceae bacterium]